MKEVENSVADAAVAAEDDGFETLPSKPLADAERNDIFRKYSFACPVCGLTGGPTFLGLGKARISVLFQGLRIPSDHAPECLEKAETAHFYVTGKMDDHQMSTFIHIAKSGECSHPKCVAERLWGKS